MVIGLRQEQDEYFMVFTEQKIHAIVLLEWFLFELRLLVDLFQQFPNLL